MSSTPRAAKVKQKPVKQPRMRPNRHPMGTMLDAPDTTDSRPRLRLKVIGVTVITLFALLGLRLWALTVLQASAASHAVSLNQIRTVPIEPTRGLILDRYGNPLVNNVVTEQITLSRVAAQNHPQVIGDLAALLGETTSQVKASIANVQFSIYKPVPVLSNAPLSDILYIKEHPELFPGVSSVSTTERNYPQGELPGPDQTGYPAEQVLGYVGTINATELKSRSAQGYQAGDPFGQSGLEYQYESELHGVVGNQQLEVTPAGEVVKTAHSQPATQGDNIVTNIDTNLQQVADNALANQIAYVRQTPDPTTHLSRPAPDGAVVVMNPQSGAILAMSSYPNYNPNTWIGGISNTDYQALQASGAQNNYAMGLNGQLPPGSTFKLVTATSALQSGLITPTTPFNDTGSYTAPGCTGPDCTLKDDVGDKPFGDINVTTALTVSSDSFFYALGAEYWDAKSQYGVTPIQNTAALYGYGSGTGIDLPDEAPGHLDTPAGRIKLHTEYPKDYPYDTWYTGDNMEVAFGQGGTLVTPLQQAVAYATFANGGTRYAPQVAAAVVSPNGKVIKRISPHITGKVTYSPSNYAALMQGFEGVINDPNGTGYPAFVGSGWNEAAFPLAGKTGTASVVNQEPTSWFVGFGPLPTSQYVVVCVINQGGYGVDAAAPVVRNVFNYLAAHPVTAPGIPPVPGNVQATKAVPLPGSLTAPASTTTTTSGHG